MSPQFPALVPYSQLLFTNIRHSPEQELLFQCLLIHGLKEPTPHSLCTAIAAPITAYVSSSLLSAPICVLCGFCCVYDVAHGQQCFITIKIPAEFDLSAFCLVDDNLFDVLFHGLLLSSICAHLRHLRILFNNFPISLRTTTRSFSNRSISS